MFLLNDRSYIINHLIIMNRNNLLYHSATKKNNNNDKKINLGKNRRYRNVRRYYQTKYAYTQYPLYKTYIFIK
jgi:hypothetical protein